MPYGLDAAAMVVLVVAAVALGVSKALLPGLGTLTIAIFAVVLPVRESVGSLLLLLLVGDGLVVTLHRHGADVRRVLQMVPGVLPGFAIGAAFLSQVSDQALQRAIGLLLLIIVPSHLRSAPADTSSGAAGAAKVSAAALAGPAAGFATMVANAGGPFMTWYLLRAGLSVSGVAGTSAYFFAVVNLVKLPVSIGLGLLSRDGLTLSLLLSGPMVLGALGGFRCARSISHEVFAWTSAVVAAGAAVLLLVA